MNFKNILIIALSSLVLFGCDSSSNSPPSVISAFSLPSNIEVARASESSAASFASLAAFSDTGTDYATHFTDTWLDSDMDALNMINDVLKIIDDSGYKDFVNDGPYKALITPPGGDDNKAAGGDKKSSTKVEKLTPMTVNVTRTDLASPMNIDFWMTMHEDEGPNGAFDILIKGHIEVSKGANDTTLPWGVFTFDVEGTAGFGGSLGDLKLFKMGIKTIENADGLAEMEFIDSGTSPVSKTATVSGSNSIHVIANKDLSAGNMRVLLNDGVDTDSLYVTFNDDYFIDFLDSDSSSFEFSKKFSDLKQTAFDYAVFNKATGAKLSLNAGMPFKTADGKFGYAGNWGIWAESQNLIVNGAQITSEGSNPVTYTVVAKNGKLVKHVKVSKTLADIAGLPLYMWDNNTQKDKVIKWNSASSIFQQVGTMGNDSDGNWVLTPFTVGNYVTLNTGNTDEWDGGWVESLNTFLEIGRYINGGVSLSDSTAIQYYVESTVKPGDTSVPSTLYTKEWVPNFSVANANALETQQDNHYNCWGNSPENCKSPALTFDTTNYTLKNGSTEIIAPNKSTLDLSDSRYSGGVQVWGLVAATNGESYGADTFYSWNMGDNEWNKFISVKNAAGELVAFDQPIRISYKHVPTNDRNYALSGRDTQRDNMLYQMDYDGNHLNIPWFFNNSSSDSNDHDWEPEINLKDGAILTDGTTEYVVKGTDVMLTMKRLSVGGSGLTVDKTTSDPTITYNAGKIAAMPVKPILDADGTAIKVKVSKGKKI